MPNCRTRKRSVSSGIWKESNFNKKPVLFCYEECKKEFIKKKINRIKVEYPNMYKRLLAEYDKNKGSGITLLKIAEKYVI